MCLVLHSEHKMRTFSVLYSTVPVHVSLVCYIICQFNSLT